jgi:hypothetical protein
MIEVSTVKVFQVYNGTKGYDVAHHSTALSQFQKPLRLYFQYLWDIIKKLIKVTKERYKKLYMYIWILTKFA